jgi:hypothetical protein
MKWGQRRVAVDALSVNEPGALPLDPSSVSSFAVPNAVSSKCVNLLVNGDFSYPSGWGGNFTIPNDASTNPAIGWRSSSGKIEVGTCVLLLSDRLADGHHR